MNGSSQARIVVVGAGLIGRSHMAVINSRTDCFLTAVVDPLPAAEVVAAKYGVPLFKSLDALLAQHQADGIVLATPNPLHVPQALACIKAGVPVQAFASNTTRGFAVEDTVAINLRFASGVLGTFLLSDTAACARSWEQTSQENKAYPSYDDEDCYVISGTLGSLSVPTMRVKAYASPGDRSWWNPFNVSTVRMQRQDPLNLQMAHFVQVIQGRADPLVTARDGLANLRVTEAIAEAAKRGTVVELHPY